MQKIDDQIIKQSEILIKYLSKGYRDGKTVSPAQVTAYAKLLGEYRCLIEAAQKNGTSGNTYYNRMEAEALKEAKANMKH